MKPEHSAILDDLLSRWHSWQSTATARGHNSRAAGFESYRTSRQYDDVNGALDSDLDDERSKAVDFAVTGMRDPYRAAIYMEALNLATGSMVWSSPRMPVERAKCQEITAEARGMLCRKLIEAGVI